MTKRVIDKPVMALQSDMPPLNFGRTINYLIYSSKEFTSKRRAKDSFLKNVLTGPKIMLIGHDDDLKAA
jgi:hypothetical protein